MEINANSAAARTIFQRDRHHTKRMATTVKT